MSMSALRPEFARFIRNEGAYTRPEGGRGGPSVLDGPCLQVDGLSAVPCRDLGNAVNILGIRSSVDTRLPYEPELAERPVETVFGKLLTAPAVEAGRRVLANVQAALGGQPVAFGMSYVHHMEDGMFCVAYNHAQTQGGAYEQPVPEDRLNPLPANGMIYVDSAHDAIYVHPHPTDPQWR